jgi:hypothetical protein
MERLVGNTCRGGPCEQQHGAVRAPFQLLQAGGERCSRGRAEAVAAGGGEGGRCGPRLELQPLVRESRNIEFDKNVPGTGKRVQSTRGLSVQKNFLRGGGAEAVPTSRRALCGAPGGGNIENRPHHRTAPVPTSLPNVLTRFSSGRRSLPGLAPQPHRSLCFPQRTLRAPQKLAQVTFPVSTFWRAPMRAFCDCVKCAAAATTTAAVCMF